MGQEEREKLDEERLASTTSVWKRRRRFGGVAKKRGESHQ